MADAITPTIQCLENPSERVLDHVAHVLKLAFGDDDPFTKFLVGGDMSLVPLELGANVRAAAIGGKIHVAAVGPEPDDIVGAAIWYAPGQAAMSTEEQRAVGWNQFIEVIPGELRSWWLDYFIPAVGKVSDDTLGAGYKLKSWHLHLFGVIPEYQRKGIGKALIQKAENLAKAENSPIVLETVTDVDVLIYKRMGFEEKGEVVIKSPYGEARLRVMTKVPGL